MSAQSPPDSSSSESSFGTTQVLTLFLTILLLLLFFVGFFSVYFCRCFKERIMSILNLRSGAPLGTPVIPDPPGLHPDIINSFQTFDYSSVKDYRPGALECAICLSEFQDDDFLRLIPECCHVYHQECIDIWLASHKSCPVCRRGLDPDDEDKPGLLDGAAPDLDRVEGDGECNIEVKEDEDDENVGRFGSRFSRSHSTGHSIVKAPVEDRCTLRLPEDVMGRAGHVQALSCTTFGEMGKGPTPRGGQGRFYFGEL